MLQISSFICERKITKDCYTNFTSLNNFHGSWSSTIDLVHVCYLINFQIQFYGTTNVLWRRFSIDLHLKYPSIQVRFKYPCRIFKSNFLGKEALTIELSKWSKFIIFHENFTCVLLEIRVIFNKTYVFSTNGSLYVLYCIVFCTFFCSLHFNFSYKFYNLVIDSYSAERKNYSFLLT